MFFINGIITKGVGGLYFVNCNEVVYKCYARGLFRKNKIIPTIGDKVEIDVLSEQKKEGSIIKIFERQNILIRPKVSNIDSAFIIFSCKNPNINFTLLDKFLVLAEFQKIKNINIVINKCDLVNQEIFNKINNIYSKYYKIIFTSTLENIGINLLKYELDKKTSVFAGPSGVGKSTLINCIYPKANLKTGQISEKIGRGKHTTRQVELIKIWDKTFIIDSPGFTSLELNFIKQNELKLYFREFIPFSNKCKFNDCNHIFEPNCVIKSEVEKNYISIERYERYKELFNELEV